MMLPTMASNLFVSSLVSLKSAGFKFLFVILSSAFGYRNAIHIPMIVNIMPEMASSVDVISLYVL